MARVMIDKVKVWFVKYIPTLELQRCEVFDAKSHQSYATLTNMLQFTNGIGHK